MVEKKLPFTHEKIEEIAKEFGTPIFVYDEAGIRENCKRLAEVYSWSIDYKNYFAVKANSTPAMLRIIESEGMGFDCGNMNELKLLKRYGLGENGIFFTSNNTADEGYRFAEKMGATINVDKEEFVTQVENALGKLPKKMAIRYNPGEVKSGNSIIGDPIKAKFGETKEGVLKAVKQMFDGGVEEIGLHTMVVSNEKNPEYFGDTARLLRELADEIKSTHNIAVAFINIGGGVGLSYHENDPAIDLESIGAAVKEHLEDLNIPIVSENGRYVTGDHGYMLTRVTNGIVESYDRFLQVDTSINNLVRLATVTAAYHYLEILGKKDDETEVMTVVGSMCANTDRMFKDRNLPKTARAGDLMVIFDVGAHSRVNSHNYNSLLRAGEVLVTKSGDTKLIRRHETLDDLFATIKEDA